MDKKTAAVRVPDELQPRAMRTVLLRLRISEPHLQGVGQCGVVDHVHQHRAGIKLPGLVGCGGETACCNTTVRADKDKCSQEFQSLKRWCCGCIIPIIGLLAACGNHPTTAAHDGNHPTTAAHDAYLMYARLEQSALSPTHGALSCSPQQLPPLA